MKRLIAIALGMMILAGVQAGLGSLWRPLGVKPDLVLTCLIALGVAVGPRPALFGAAAGGLALDLMSVLPPGTHVIALALAVPLTAFRARSADTSSIVLPLMLTVPATLLYNCVLSLEVTLLGRPIGWGVWVAQIVVPLMVVNTLFVPIFWLPLAVTRRNRPRFALNR